ncbi:lipoprotein [Sulfuricaulis limicola]|uniref:Lipoprotein n=1 Tax=Sulfuricaulis limicola TaxID=1620215 RepID=A0A1B4XE67_9GAMM|nr:outer membrane protein assembly factor BamC [Sulfuricaulis limicola]BAV33088.1 lipoprotein [Sulfuricaulis limicola]
MTIRFARLLLCLLAAVSVGACQTIAEKRKIDYKATRTLPPLDIPPELAAPEGAGDAKEGAPVPGAATYSGFVSGEGKKQTAAGSDVLPAYDGIRLERAGQIRWLVVKLPAEQLWPRVREFVLDRGLIIDQENPQTGVLETDWAENRAKVGTGMQKILAKSLGTLYSTGLRDKYRIRLERGKEPGTTEIYLSHRGMVETLVGNDPSGIGETRWQPRPSDPDLEAEMLRLLMASLGVKEEKAASMIASSAGTTAPERAKLNREKDSISLSLSEDFERAWRRVGLVLDRTSFTVDDRDRSKGVYYVRYIDPDVAQKKKGWFRRLFSKKEAEPTNEYQIVLKGNETATRVDVLTREGAPEQSGTSERILTLLYDQLK